MSNELQWLRQALDRIENKQDSQAETLARIDVHLSNAKSDVKDLEGRLGPLEEDVKFTKRASKTSLALLGLVATLKSMGLF